MEAYHSTEYREAPLLSSLADEQTVSDLSLDQMRQLLQIIAIINRGMDLDQVLEQLYRAAGRFIPCNRLGLSLVDAEGKIATSRWVKSDRTTWLGIGYQAPLAGSTLQTILETGKVRIISDLERYAQDHPHSVSTRLLLQEGMRSSLTCPLAVRGQPIGFLFFTSVRVDAYTDAQLLLYQHIATQVSVVIEKARLYSELAQHTLAIERQNNDIRRDLELAAQLQRTFVPEEPPRIKGLDMAIVYEPLTQVGGDLVEVVPLKRDQTLVFVADAMGHGVPAALAMAIVKATFQSLLRERITNPGEILQQLNSALTPLLKTQFATALAILIDTRTGRLKLARAAAPPPVIVDGATGRARVVEHGGLPLSVSASEPYPSVELPFRGRDTLLIATDGMIESINAVGDQFGMEGLLGAASTCQADTAKDCLWAVMDKLTRFRGTHLPADDMTVVLIRRTAS